MNENEKVQILEPVALGRFAIFLQRAAIRTLFDVSWSLVAQAVAENELFLYQSSGIAIGMVPRVLLLVLFTSVVFALCLSQGL